MFVSFLCLIAITQTYGLILEDNRPGAIPILSRGVNNAPGGIAFFDIQDPANFDRIEHLLNFAVDVIQDQQAADPKNAKNYVFHKVIRAKEATLQIVNGRIYEVIFFVGERECLRPLASPGGGGNSTKRGFRFAGPGAANETEDGGKKGKGSPPKQERNETSGGKSARLPPPKSHEDHPWPIPGPVHCHIKHGSQLGQCYAQIFYQPQNTSIQIKKIICVKASEKDVAPP